MESYEVKKARTGHLVPIVNGAHIHSIYNPIKEADGFVTKNETILEERKEILILGLGFGYHVNQAILRMRKIHGGEFKIVVIEPNENMLRECNNHDLLVRENLVVYSGKSVEELYRARELANFLACRPGVVAHSASFNLYGDYFKRFLSYTAPQKIHDICNAIKSSDLKEYLKDFGQGATLEQCISEEISTKRHLDDDLDYLFLAYKHLTGGKRQSGRETLK